MKQLRVNIPLILLLAGLTKGLAGGMIIQVDPAITGPTADLGHLLGTNLAPWYEPSDIEKPGFQKWLKEWSPGLVRLPGGSWSNEYYWNGNGVRLDEETFDSTKFRNGRWDVDYSDYAPGFRIHGAEQQLSDYHGVIDVKKEHEIAESLGADQLITVNLGSGTVEMAEEWLKWANKQGYSVPFWEIGNELNGQWEIGHFQADGSSMTGEIYARKYLEYSRALKAIDSSIKTGGPACSDLNLAFVEELIRDAGDELDFITLHAYPVGVQRSKIEDKFSDIKLLEEALEKVEKWKRLYQPERADEILIGITEWNMKVNEDRDTADIINGLWSAEWIGTMLEGGVNFSTEWDLLTTTAEGGHGAFYIGEDTVIPKSLFWSHYLWRHHMGNTVIQHKVEGDEPVAVFTTRSVNGVHVMVINKSPDSAAEVTIQLPDNLRIANEGYQVTFSRQEYFWDPNSHKPLWSREPTIKRISSASLVDRSVPAFSIRIFKLPFEGKSFGDDISPVSVGQPELKWVLPESHSADLPLEAWIVAWDKVNNIPYQGELSEVRVKVDGPADNRELEVVLDQSVGQVFLNPTAEGKLKVTAMADSLSVTSQVRLLAVESRPIVLWTFDNPIEAWGASSTFEIGMDTSVRPNESVARTTLDGSLPVPNEDVLLMMENFSNKLPINRIGGIFGEVRTSGDLQTDDPEAAVRIVLQSEADHWMELGSIPFSDISGEWKQFTYDLDDPRLLKAMARLYSIRIVFSSTSPITGEVYFDNIGFKVRSEGN